MNGDKQKKGRPKNNKEQNRQVKNAAQKVGLDRKQREKFKRELEKLSRKMGENLSYEEIQQIAQEIKDGFL